MKPSTHILAQISGVWFLLLGSLLVISVLAYEDFASPRDLLFNIPLWEISLVYGLSLFSAGTFCLFSDDERRKLMVVAIVAGLFACYRLALLIFGCIATNGMWSSVANTLALESFSGFYVDMVMAFLLALAVFKLIAPRLSSSWKIL